MLYGMFALLVGLMVGIASASDPVPLNLASRVLILLIQPAFALSGGINAPVAQTDPSADPILFFHYILGVDALIGLLALYFLVCLVLAWCWTWVARRASGRRLE